MCVLKIGYNLLCYDFEIFYRLWDWSFIFKFLLYRYFEVRWYVFYIVVILIEMLEYVKYGFLDKFFSIEEKNLFVIYECLIRELWILREEYVIRNEFCFMVLDFMVVDINSINELCISDKDLIGEYVIICGVLLLRLFGILGFVDKFFVMVLLIVSNFYLFVLLVVLGYGVLFEGFIGFGKISLVEYLVKVIGRISLFDFIKV